MRPVARALAAAGIVPTLVFTGQHARLKPADFGLDIFPALLLACPGQADPHAHVQAVARALQPLLLRDRPDLLAVQGDTSSALGGALAALGSAVPLAHVEAGLRTHDPRLPWPEEEYRIAIDASADLLFAPTERAAANLRAEQVHGDIHVTGNTSIDAVFEAAKQLPSPAPKRGGPLRLLVTCHRRESWDGGLESIAAALGEIARKSDARIEVVLHPNGFVARTMRARLAGIGGIALLEPCGHDQLLRRMRDSALVLSDSGGIQEEAPALGVPLLVLRDKTERPEGIEAGVSLLVGTDAARITAEVRRLLDDPAALAAMSRPALPFGDGRAGERIAEIAARWLEQRSLTRRLA
jgi:UDP-N-acetylglucosamine 2-epimerase (non-hydrolysing)